MQIVIFVLFTIIVFLIFLNKFYFYVFSLILILCNLSFLFCFNIFIILFNFTFSFSDFSTSNDLFWLFAKATFVVSFKICKLKFV